MATLTAAEKEARTRLALAAIASWGTPLCGGGTHAEHDFDAEVIAREAAADTEIRDALASRDAALWAGDR